METAQLISEFLASEHGAQALQALGAQGVSDADARDLLSHVDGGEGVMAGRVAEKQRLS